MVDTGGMTGDGMGLVDATSLPKTDSQSVRQRVLSHLHPIYMPANTQKKSLKEGWDHGTMGPFSPPLYNTPFALVEGGSKL